MNLGLAAHQPRRPFPAAAEATVAKISGTDRWVTVPSHGDSLFMVVGGVPAADLDVGQTVLVVWADGRPERPWIVS